MIRSRDPHGPKFLYGGNPECEGTMSTDVSKDQLVLVTVSGMHCHKCEVAITKALSAIPGVHEVEVDFNSGQASVLFDRTRVAAPQLIAAVNDAGYQATGFTQREAG